MGWALLVLLLFLTSPALAAEPKFPALTGRVVHERSCSARMRVSSPRAHYSGVISGFWICKNRSCGWFPDGPIDLVLAFGPSEAKFSRTVRG